VEAPIFIGSVELTEPVGGSEPLARPDGATWTQVRLLVRMQGIPVGYAFLPPALLDAAAVARQIWAQLGAAINARRADRGLPALFELPVSGIAPAAELVSQLTEFPLVSVVLCTRDRPAGAMVTLRGLAALRYDPFEIVVVDNAPSSDATEAAVRAEFGADPRVRYVREPRPGLSVARNCGVAAAAGQIVAFTDDDVRVDPYWLDGIVRGFRQGEEVACVTGLIPTAEIDNAAQLYFDQRATWGTGCEGRLFDLTAHRDASPLYPYSAGIYGTGANFALAATALKELGPFDEALGAGSPCGGGEDLEMFVRVILAGRTIAYEPSAIVSHVHRADLAQLSRQMVAYGSGCTAALTAIVLRHPRARLELASRLVSGVLRIFAIRDRVHGNASLPSGLMRQEFRGMLLGPWRYYRGRRALPRDSQARRALPRDSQARRGAGLPPAAGSESASYRAGRRRDS
jgi:GT2 family glycosyltransferase